MDKDYFNSLMKSVQDSEQPTSNSSNTLGKAFLTVKIDIDCKLYCDGDFLDLFEANKVKKIPIETGQHLFTIESEHSDGVSEDHVVDAAEAGKNYLLLVNGMKQKEKEIFRPVRLKNAQSACHPIVNPMLSHPSLHFSVDYCCGNNS